jgi:uncharacterized protein YbjQ (UPF0145 family)
LIASEKGNYLIEKRWAFAAIIIGFLLGFLSAFICVALHLVIFGFNIMYIVSPLIAGFAETYIARKKYGRSTGAISALLTFILINIYGWLIPGWIYPKEPATLSIITLIAIGLMLQAAFPTLINYILLVVVVGTFTRIIGFLVTLPSKIQGKPPEVERKEMITGPPVDDIFLDKLTMPLMSIPHIEEGKIKKYLGLVIGEAITKEKESEGRLSKFIKQTQLEDLNLGEARKAALSRMLENAKSLGANAVIEVLIDYNAMGGLQGSALIVTATGTAVIVQDEYSNPSEKVSREGSMSGTDEKIIYDITGKDSDVNKRISGIDKEINTSNIDQKVSDVDKSLSVIDEKINTSNIDQKVSNVDKRISSMDEGIKEKISYTVSTDDLTNRVEQYLTDQREQLIKDWELSTKNDLGELEKRFSKVSRNLDNLDNEIEEDWEYTNKKINVIEDRLKKLEIPEL